MIKKVILVLISLCANSPSMAQTRTARDTATAYGARLTGKGQPENLNESRVNDRVDSRIDNRLRLRIERYRPDSNNPTIAFQDLQDDQSYIAPNPVPVQQTQLEAQNEQ